MLEIRSRFVSSCTLWFVLVSRKAGPAHSTKDLHGSIQDSQSSSSYNILR